MEPQPRVAARGRLFALVLVVAAALYGNSYQQFRHLDLSDPRGVSDSRSYIEMSQGNYDVSSTHLYRIVVPTLAGALQRIMGPDPDEDAVKLSFFLVNFAFMAVAALFLYLLLESLGFAPRLALIGTLLFLASRITVISTATPLVDSFFYASVSVISYLVLTERPRLLAVLNPILILSKETILPFLFLPLLVRGFRRPLYLASLVLSLAWLVAIRRQLWTLASEAHGEAKLGLIDVVLAHVGRSGDVVGHLFSFGGMHDLQNGFSSLLLAALVGWAWNRKSRHYRIPLWLMLQIPVALTFSILSGNLGRMFFAAYVPLIAYVLIFIERMFPPAPAPSPVTAPPRCSA